MIPQMCTLYVIQRVWQIVLFVEQSFSRKDSIHSSVGILPLFTPRFYCNKVAFCEKFGSSVHSIRLTICLLIKVFPVKIRRNIVESNIRSTVFLFLLEFTSELHVTNESIKSMTIGIAVHVRNHTKLEFTSELHLTNQSIESMTIGIAVHVRIILSLKFTSELHVMNGSIESMTIGIAVHVRTILSQSSPPNFTQ